MEAVVKVGGSLAKNHASLAGLCRELNVLAKAYRSMIVPGGDKFADTIREFDINHSLSNTVAHKMAILAMDQYGIFLSDLIPDSYVSYSPEEIINSARSALPVFLHSRYMFREDPLEHSWDATSDTIAAFIAGLLHSKKLILVTDVDGIFSEDPDKNSDATLIQELTAKELLGWNKKTSVDKTLPKILLQTRLDCYVVNGIYPERIGQILRNEKTICTHVTV